MDVGHRSAGASNFNITKHHMNGLMPVLGGDKMATRLGRFEMPKQVIRDDKVSTDTYGKFYAEPFEGGYGRTMGNSLRRVLLSSLEGRRFHP